MAEGKRYEEYTEELTELVGNEILLVADTNEANIDGHLKTKKVSTTNIGKAIPEATVKTKYESNLDTNAFTDSEKSKLTNQSNTNSGDETAGTIKTKYESNLDTNAFTDSEKTILASQSNTNSGDETASSIKTKYESNANTNAFTDTLLTKLTNIEDGADVTDTINVESAGAVMESDTTTASMGFVVDEDDMVSDSPTKIPTQQSVKAYVDANAGGGGGINEISISAGEWNYPTSNPAPLDTISGTNGVIKGNLFDDTTEELVIKKKTLPSTVNAGTVTFTVEGFSITAVASKNIAIKLYHSAIGEGEDWDSAYSTITSGDEAVQDTQDNLTVITFTETIANLGWSANDSLRLKLSRIAPTINNLVGDFIITNFSFELP